MRPKIESATTSEAPCCGVEMSQLQSQGPPLESFLARYRSFKSRRRVQRVTADLAVMATRKPMGLVPTSAKPFVCLVATITQLIIIIAHLNIGFSQCLAIASSTKNTAKHWQTRRTTTPQPITISIIEDASLLPGHSSQWSASSESTAGLAAQQARSLLAGGRTLEAPASPQSPRTFAYQPSELASMLSAASTTATRYAEIGKPTLPGKESATTTRKERRASSSTETNERDKLTNEILRAFPSERNRQLVRKLRSQKLDFQVFYPRLEHKPDPDIDEHQEQEPHWRDHNGARQRKSPSSSSYSSLSVANLPDGAKSFSLLSSLSRQQQLEARVAAEPNQVLGHYNRTNVVITAFNYKFRLDLELNNNLFAPGLIQKHFLLNGAHISTQRIENCYYHARTQPEARPPAIGAFKACNGLSGIIHVNNESFVVLPFDANSTRKHPHIIYRHRATSASGDTSQQQPEDELAVGEQVNNNFRGCGNSRLHELGLRQWDKPIGVANPLAGSSLPIMNNQFFASAQDNHLSMDGSDQHDDEHFVSSSQAKAAAGPATMAEQEGSDCAHCDQSADSLEKSTISESNKNNNIGRNSKRQADVVSADESNQQQQHKVPNAKFNHKRDVTLFEKHIEFGLVISQDFFDKRNSSNRSEVLHDAIQIVNCLDLYFRSANTRVALTYIETWAYGDQIELSHDVKESLFNFLDYSTEKFQRVQIDAVHLLTGGYARQFEFNEVGMSMPESICKPHAVSISQEASIFEPFITASTMAHMVGHNLGLEHDLSPSQQAAPTTEPPGPVPPVPKRKATESGASNGFNENDDDDDSGMKVRSLQTTANGSSKDHHHQHQLQALLANYYDQTGPAAALSSSEPPLSFRDEFEELIGGYCETNCIMSEHFNLFPPPVSIGYMTLQEIATNGSNGHSFLSTMNASQPSSLFPLGSSLWPPNKQTNLNQMIDSRQQQQQQQYNQQNLNQNQMYRQPTFVSTNLPFKFSRQSIETYHAWLREGRGVCLYNKPSKREDFKNCGDGIVNKGEDCDCGRSNECTEPCCDPMTCKFRAEAECRSGACCDNCKLRRRGFVCRKSRGECDLPEMCDGLSSQCAPDVHKHNGYPCQSGAGYCYLGHCPTHDYQCFELWGSDAKRSDQLCYSTFNLNGTFRGNCGSNLPQHSLDSGAPGGGHNPAASSAAATPTLLVSASMQRKFKRCDPEHMMCGTLQCQQGDMKPVTASLDYPPAPPPLANSAAATRSSLSQASASAANNNSSSTRASNASHEYSKKIVRASDGSQHECNVITGPTWLGGAPSGGGSSNLAAATLGTLVSSNSYVRDGSKCAQNKICFNQTCQPVELVYWEPFKLCPRDERGYSCSGNGICSTANRCQCNEGWTGRDCSQRWLPSAAIASTISSSSSSKSNLGTSAAGGFRIGGVWKQAAGYNSKGYPQTKTSISSSSNSSLGNQRNFELQQPPTQPNSDNNNFLTNNNLSPMPERNFVRTTQQPTGDQQFITANPAQQQGVTPPLIVVVNGSTASGKAEAPGGQETTNTTEAPAASSQTAANNSTHVALNSSSGTSDRSSGRKDAFGAPTLVFFLVSIVAGVYVGFAIMANCYRRKGFKPDKVLRHHQMNCKLDAIRSSFIARRLAEGTLDIGQADGDDADGGLGGAGPNVLQQQQPRSGGRLPMLGGGGVVGGSGNSADMLSDPFMSSMSGQAPCQHYNTGEGELDLARLSGRLDGPSNEILMKGFLSSNSAQQLPQHLRSILGNQQQSPASQQQQFAATVHYFDEQAAGGEHGDCVGAHQPNRQPPAAAMMGAYETGSGDHIPLLMSQHSDQGNNLRNPHRVANRVPIAQQIMRSFNPSSSVNPQQQQQQQQQQFLLQGLSTNSLRLKVANSVSGGTGIHQDNQWTSPRAPLSGSGLHSSSFANTATGPRQQPNAGSRDHQILNRALSLGNVNRVKQLSRQLQDRYGFEEFEYDDDGEDEDDDDRDGGGAREARKTMSAHTRALATPLRSANNNGHPRQLVRPTLSTGGGGASYFYRRGSASRQNKASQQMEFDSCSAPSSPEHRDPCWSDAERQRCANNNNLANTTNNNNSRLDYPLSRQSSASRLAAGLSRQGSRQAETGGYHEDAILGALAMQQQQRLKQVANGRQQSFEQTVTMTIDAQETQAGEETASLDDGREADEMPLPSPPPPPPAHLLADNCTAEQAETEEDSEEPNQQLNNFKQQQQGQRQLVQQQQLARQQQSSQFRQKHTEHQAQGNSAKSSANLSSWSLRTIKRVPLNNGDEHELEQRDATSEFSQQQHLSLIAQLQQLERVQSLHQKQVANDKKLNSSGEGLHEFFSLPLSVQLSALLTRSIYDTREPTAAAAATAAAATMAGLSSGSGGSTAAAATPIDDYLNLLNNSSVATSSRRSFKRPGGQQQQQQQSAASSRGGTLKRQQVKLQNLQGLINRLQQLHSQTMLQQQLGEFGELGEMAVDARDVLASAMATAAPTTRPTRHLASNRPSRSVSRANQTADDLFAVQQRHARAQLLRDETVGPDWTNRDNLRPNARKSREILSENKRNESVYSMSDSEDGGVFVSRMLAYQQQQHRGISEGRGDGGGDDHNAQEETEPVTSNTSRGVKDLNGDNTTSNNNNNNNNNGNQRQQQPATTESPCSPLSSSLDANSCIDMPPQSAPPLPLPPSPPLASPAEEPDQSTTPITNGTRS